MATVSKKSNAPASRPIPPGASPKPAWPLRALDAVYRFLASLKLAVMLLTTLAAALCYATVYEKMHGTEAVQLDVYGSKPFALLLALLGVNILCAATIRFPWKRRQTGFVITHAGLIVLLIGAFVSLKVTDDGDVALAEGASTAQYLRSDSHVLRVQKIDGESGEVERQFAVGFSPGAQPWESEKTARAAQAPGYKAGLWALRAALGLIAAGLLAVVLVLAFRQGAWLSRPLGASLATLMTLSAAGLGSYAATMRMGPRVEVLTESADPYRLVVKDFLPSASEPRPVHEAGPDGVPMLRVALLTQPPDQTRAVDSLGGRGWLVTTGTELAHATHETGPARIEYQALHGPHAEDALDAFLHPPAEPLSTRRARFYYDDASGQRRSYDFDLAKADRTQAVTLPDSDISVRLVTLQRFATRGEQLMQLSSLGRNLLTMLMQAGRATALPEVSMALFRVKKGDGPEALEGAWAGLPMGESMMQAQTGAKSPVWIDYYEPPPIDAGSGAPMQGTFGAVQFASTPDGQIYYRAFGRDGLRGSGPVKTGEPVQIFGGGKMPMKVWVRVDELLDSGITRYVCEPVEVGPEQRAVPAALIELSVGGKSQEFWLPKSLRNGPDYQLKMFGDEFWKISYDTENAPLPFEVNLVDFNPSNDPGSSERSSYRSDVFLQEPGTKPADLVAFSEVGDGEAFLFPDRPRETMVKVKGKSYRPFDGGQPIPVDDPSLTVRPIPTPQKITMNNPLVKDHWTLYQSSFSPVTDQSNRPTGRYFSILTARYDPAWPITYIGGLMVGVGAFLQFYMMGLSRIFGSLLGRGGDGRATDSRRKSAAEGAEDEFEL